MAAAGLPPLLCLVSLETGSPAEDLGVEGLGFERVCPSSLAHGPAVADSIDIDACKHTIGTFPATLDCEINFDPLRADAPPDAVHLRSTSDCSACAMARAPVRTLAKAAVLAGP